MFIDGNFQDNVDAINDMIDDAKTITDLVAIEEMIGVQELLGVEDWECIPPILSKLQSPYVDIYERLKDTWESIEGIE